jgi:hypothetical protein
MKDKYIYILLNLCKLNLNHFRQSKILSFFDCLILLLKYLKFYI